MSTQPLREAEKPTLPALAPEAMGFRRERGDSLNVVNSAFTDMEKEIIPELPLWQQPEMIELAKQIAKTALIGALIAYLVLGVLRPMLKRMNQPAGASTASSPMLTEQKEDQPLPSKPAIKQVLQLSQPDQNLALARQLARDDPQMVASVVRHWVAGHE